MVQGLLVVVDRIHVFQTALDQGIRTEPAQIVMVEAQAMAVEVTTQTLE